VDADGDSYGNPVLSTVACLQPLGYGVDNTDCDDLDASAYPGGSEVCDGTDNNCDNQTDEGVTSTFFVDSDDDGYGDPASPISACFAPGGSSVNGLDCNDGQSSVHPGAIEVCDGADNDCDTLVDNNPAIADTWYADLNGNGLGDASNSQLACSQPSGYVLNADDCDDLIAVSTSVTEDADCDGAVTAADCDDGDPNSTVIAADADCDGSPTIADCNDSRVEGLYAAFETDSSCPLSYWDMETLDSAGSVIDVVGGVSLLTYGSPVVVPGKSGTTYAMNGCGDYFLSSAGFPSALQGNNPRSISAWAYLGAKGGDGDGATPIAGFGGASPLCGGTSFSLNYYTIGTSNDGPMLVTCSNDIAPSGSAWALDSWHHMVGTHDGSTMTIYVDGVAVGSMATALNTGAGFNHVGIGVDTWWSASAHYMCNGRVDEVKLYDYALSPAEVTELFLL
jgi:hypothetical protein